MLYVYTRALSAVSSVRLVAQCGMAPWSRNLPAWHLFSEGSSFTSSLASSSLSLWSLSAVHTSLIQPQSSLTALLIQLSWPQMGMERGDQDQELPLMRSACLEMPQTGTAFTALGSICASGINYRVGAEQGL